MTEERLIGLVEVMFYIMVAVVMACMCAIAVSMTWSIIS